MTAPARQSRTAWRDVATSVLCVAVLGFVLLDGAASAQAQERFDRTGCGSIVDHATQLEWYVGPDTNVAWSDALSWVRRLDACGGGWHMPTLGQLRSLFDARSTAGTGYFIRGRHWPAHLDPIFSGIGAGSWVWAGEPVAQPGTGHPALNFNQDLNVVLEAGRDYTVRAFAVRATGTALPPPSIPTPNERVPVVIAARPDAEAACGKGVVFDLEPHGDGFLAVKAGPGLTFLRIDKLYNGEQVYLCARTGDWYGIVYGNDAQPCHVDRPWVLSEPYTGPCRYGWAHRRWIKPVALPEIAQPSPPVPASEPVATGDEQLEALLSRARKEKNPGLLKQFLLSHADAAGNAEIRKAYVELSDHVRSHPFGALEKLKIYEKPDIQSNVIRQDGVGESYVIVRQDEDFDFVEYDLNKYGYIYRGFVK